MNFFRNLFRLTRLRRVVILSFTFVAAILTIVLGSVFYTSQSINKGLEYGGGQEYLVQVEDTDSNEDTNIDEDLATSIADSVYERINALGTSDVYVEIGENSEGVTLLVQVPGLESEAEQEAIKDLIVDKPHLVFTDIYGNNLFDDLGNFNNDLEIGVDPGGALESPYDFAYQDVNDEGEPIGWEQNSNVPIVEGSAQVVTNQSGSYEVSIEIKPNKEQEWTQATAYVSSLTPGYNVILAWLDLDDFIYQATTDWPSEWSSSGGNIYNFAHVDNDPSKMLREEVIDSASYLISTASVSAPLTGTNFVISGNDFTLTSSQNLANLINYGTADNYELIFLQQSEVSAFYGANAFDMVVIVGIIVFALIGLFLISNYGLLGVISTLSISFYMFLTLTMFNIMEGQYSPEAIASLIIGIGMSVDANIITFERLKSEIYMGSSLKKSYKLSNVRSFSTIFDANITTLIVAFVLFFFGTRSIIGLSVMLIISILFTLIITLGFTRILTNLLVGTQLFENKRYLLGVVPKIDEPFQEKLGKVNYLKKSKYFSYGSLALLTVAILVFVITAAVGGSASSGFVLSQEFTGGTDITIVSENNTFLDQTLIEEIENTFSGIIDPNDIQWVGEPGLITEARISVGVVDDQTLGEINELASSIDSVNVSVFVNGVSNTVAKALVRDAVVAIAIAIFFVVVYTLFRFKWTYSVAAIVCLLHDALMVFAFFVVFRIEISPVFVAGLLAIIGYSINDTIVVFDQIRFKMRDLTQQEVSNTKIVALANQALRDTVKRSVLTSFTTIISIIVLMSFGTSTEFSFNMAMLVGIVVGTYSSIFIAAFIWTRLEIFSLKRQKTRVKNNFWATKGVEEQTFRSINDFRP